MPRTAAAGPFQLTTAGLVLGLTTLALLLCCQPRLEDREAEVDPYIQVNSTDLVVGDTLVISGCYEHFVDSATHSYELELDVQQNSTHFAIQGILHWVEDVNWHDDDDGTDVVDTSVSFEMLEPGTYTVHARGGVGDCDEWASEDEIEVTVSPAS